MQKLDFTRDVDMFIHRELTKRSKLTPDIVELRKYDRHLVFVYGTLKKNFSNHEILSRASAKFVGKGRTHHNLFRMYCTGGFPIVLDEADRDLSQYVYGEVYAVTPDNMMSLDRLEGNGSMYTRRKIMIRLLDQHPGGNPKAVLMEQAWMYIGGNDYWADKDRLRQVPLSIPLDSGLNAGYDWSKQ